MAILRKYATVLRDALNKRFSNVNLVEDAAIAFSLEYDHSRDPGPAPSLQRLATYAKVEFEVFHRSWVHLQHEKESYVQKKLDEGAVLNGVTRADLKPTEVWPKIMCNIDSNPPSLEKCQWAKEALEDFLLLEPTNASVERDANIVTLKRDATKNKVEADPLDARVRMKIEGPSIARAMNSTKASTEWHPLLREAA